jgi:hypothetical protein
MEVNFPEQFLSLPYPKGFSGLHNPLLVGNHLELRK